MNSFNSLGLRPELVQAVTNLDYDAPTDIQSQAIPQMVAGYDVIGQAQTGTGKTAAFSLPMLNNIDPHDPNIQALILTPTRELAIQVSNAVYRYGGQLDVRVLPIYGGQSYSRQITRLSRATQVVVGTPGRTLDLIRKGAMDLSHVSFVILDEADEMLKMGFVEDVEAIISATPRHRQTAMFSATMSKRVKQLAETYMHPEAMEIAIASDTLTVQTIDQVYHLVKNRDKLPALALVLEAETINSVLIFTKTKAGAAELAEKLLARGYPAAALHGDLDQNMREHTLRRFRSGDLRFLIGTDVMARGVDIAEVSHVINYDLPTHSQDYVHRIGRTGRAGREGTAISLVTPNEQYMLREIQKFTNQKIARRPLPTPEAVYAQRDLQFLTQLEQVSQQADLEDVYVFISDMIAEGNNEVDIAAAAIYLARSAERLRPVEMIRELQETQERSGRSSRRNKHRKGSGRNRAMDDKNMVKLKIAVGRNHGVRPGDVVGAVANESGISGKAIGAIDISQTETFFDVKSDVVNKVLNKMKTSTLRGTALNISRAS